MTIIERLKNNKEAFGLMDDDLKFVCNSRSIEKKQFMFYDKGHFTIGNPDADFSCDCVYRLVQSYQCPHPEQLRYDTGDGVIDKCKWCDAMIEPPKPKMGWVEFGISMQDKDANPYYKYHRNGNTFPIDCAFGMVGYGGIQWLNPEDNTKSLYVMGWFSTTEKGPSIPIRIRFWEEIK